MTKDTITLRGVIIPVDWDEAGNVTATGLATDQEEEYLITTYNNALDFFSILQEAVEIQGIDISEGPRKSVLVKKFKRLKKRAKH